MKCDVYIVPANRMMNIQSEQILAQNSNFFIGRSAKVS